MVEIDLHEVPLTSLCCQARHHLACLLNTYKVLLSDGPEKLPRYWKGLACLLGISTEEALSYETNQTDRVLDYWIGKNDDTATVGQLLEYLQRIDRYDVFDDFMAFDRDGMLISHENHNDHVAVGAPNSRVLRWYNASEADEGAGGSLITFDDIRHGAPQKYHAYVLYADEDREFVNHLLVTMRWKDLKLCTEDDLIPGCKMTFELVAQMIGSERVKQVILVYSPAFIQSPANIFYMKYAHAVGIEKRKPNIVPVILQDCALPEQLAFLHKLYVHDRKGKTSYEFYGRLEKSLKVIRTNKYLANGSSSSSSFSRSVMDIMEMPYGSDQGLSTVLANGMMALPSCVNDMVALPSCSAASHGLNGININGSVAHGRSLSNKSRKKSKFRKLFHFMRRSRSL